MRLTWLGPNILSEHGGEEADGERRRFTFDVLECRMELDLRAAPILMASSLLGCWFSASDEDEFPLLPFTTSEGDESRLALLADKGVRERRLARFPASISRSGEESDSSDEERTDIFGGGGIATDSGETSDFLDKKPALKRLLFGWVFSVASGAGCTGDESGDSVCSCEKVSLRSEIWGTVTSVVVSSMGDEDGIF